jgi:hypothetical protein
VIHDASLLFISALFLFVDRADVCKIQTQPCERDVYKPACIQLLALWFLHKTDICGPEQVLRAQFSTRALATDMSVILDLVESEDVEAVLHKADLEAIKARAPSSSATSTGTSTPRNTAIVKDLLPIV